MELKEKIEKANIKVSEIAEALNIQQATVYRCLNNQGYIRTYLEVNDYVNNIIQEKQFENFEVLRNVLKKEFNIEIEYYYGGFIFSTNFKFISLKHNSISNNISVILTCNLLYIQDLEVFKLEIEKAQTIINMCNNLI
jgi:hypothetical protein